MRCALQLRTVRRAAEATLVRAQPPAGRSELCALERRPAFAAAGAGDAAAAGAKEQPQDPAQLGLEEQLGPASPETFACQCEARSKSGTVAAKRSSNTHNCTAMAGT